MVFRKCLKKEDEICKQIWIMTITMREIGHLDGADVCWLREIFFHREEQIDRVLKIHNEYFYQIYIKLNQIDFKLHINLLIKEKETSI